MCVGVYVFPTVDVSVYVQSDRYDGSSVSVSVPVCRYLQCLDIQAAGYMCSYLHCPDIQAVWQHVQISTLSTYLC